MHLPRLFDSLVFSRFSFFNLSFPLPSCNSAILLILSKAPYDVFLSWAMSAVSISLYRRRPLQTISCSRPRTTAASSSRRRRPCACPAAS